MPARFARVPFYRSVLADIGDHQSLAANLSTFTSHVANIGAMIESCETPALVLLDEVGTGTDPEEVCGRGGGSGVFPATAVTGNNAPGPTRLRPLGTRGVTPGDDPGRPPFGGVVRHSCCGASGGGEIAMGSV